MERSLFLLRPFGHPCLPLSRVNVWSQSAFQGLDDGTDALHEEKQDALLLLPAGGLTSWVWEAPGGEPAKQTGLSSSLLCWPVPRPQAELSSDNLIVLGVRRPPHAPLPLPALTSLPFLLRKKLPAFSILCL